MVWTPFTRADHDRSGQRYASDMTDREWRFVAPFMPGRPAKGRKLKTDLRSVVAAIFYVLQSGCQWSLLPKDFPPKSTVHHYFKRFRVDGTWSLIHDALYGQIHDLKGRQESPTYPIIDSQSVKTGPEARGDTGFDAGKTIKGRKRHILVDTLGMILKTEVQSAGIQSLPRRRRIPRPNRSKCKPEAHRNHQAESEGLRGSAKTLDCRTNLRMARHQPANVKGCRALRPNQLGIYPSRHDPTHGKAIGEVLLFLNRL